VAIVVGFRASGPFARTLEIPVHYTMRPGFGLRIDFGAMLENLDDSPKEPTPAIFDFKRASIIRRDLAASLMPRYWCVGSLVRNRVHLSELRS
jgi:hypothetical protein